ncbi:MAG: ATPase, partial [Sedimentisphaerales bacterium]
ISTMFDAFYEKKPVTTERLLKSIGQTVPLSKTMSEDVDGLRKWAEGRARLATSAEIAAESGADQRKLEI